MDKYINGKSMKTRILNVQKASNQFFPIDTKASFTKQVLLILVVCFFSQMSLWMQTGKELFDDDDDDYDLFIYLFIYLFKEAIFPVSIKLQEISTPIIDTTFEK